jgi:hypothetical protein
VHSLSLEMDWCNSPPYQVEVRPGELVELEGGARWRGFLWWWGNMFAPFILPGWVFVIRPAVDRGARPRFQCLWEGVHVVAGIVFSFSCLFLLSAFAVAALAR